MSEVCSDNRFELIGEFKDKIVKGTNIEMQPEETTVLDNILFRFWQMGWLDKLKAQEPVKPYVQYSEHTGTKWLTCGACNEPMNKVSEETWPNYCPNCGRKVWYE